MDYLGIGPLEVFMIMVVAVIIWGPSRIVDIGRTLGKTVRAFQKAASDLSIEITREVEEGKKTVSRLPEDDINGDETLVPK
jgi:sec-independent protein translocase protein TatA